jgi:MFS family permease
VRQLGAATTNLQWLVDPTRSSFAPLILAAGSLSDRFGRQGILLLGLAGLRHGDAGRFIVHDPEPVDRSPGVHGHRCRRDLSGCVVADRQRLDRARRAPKAIGLRGATTGIGVAAGSIVGGWMLERFWWASAFLFMVPMAAIVAGLVAIAVPTSKDPATPVHRNGGHDMKAASPTSGGTERRCRETREFGSVGISASSVVDGDAVEKSALNVQSKLIG